MNYQLHDVCINLALFALTSFVFVFVQNAIVDEAVNKFCLNEVNFLLRLDVMK